ncbi:MAG: hypothetical protein LBQ15_08825, partial [Clostridium sp.]|nr:hypothetical protein [Clostridium sp.]
STVCKGSRAIAELRYSISASGAGAKEPGRCIRGHRAAESSRRRSDVAFREDAGRTWEKRAACHGNVLDKVALSVLEIAGSGKEAAGLKKNRYSISLGPLRFLKMALSVWF